jgi:two-component system, chemotaxis family, chemotaxis protein CheY
MAYNVLIVDDSAVMRAMVIKSLQLCGVSLGEIHQAGDGAQALRLLDEHQVDLALVDMNMPVMNGEELLDRIRQNPATADVPVIVVSTESSQTRIALIERKGAAFVHKPFKPMVLRETVLRVMGIEC